MDLAVPPSSREEGEAEPSPVVQTCAVFWNAITQTQVEVFLNFSAFFIFF
jgi:hypothetical protein